MSEAIISRRRKVNINYQYETIYNDIYNYIDRIVYDPPLSEFVPMSMNYTVPMNLAGNQITVALYGAKGADNETSSGQGGEVVVQDIIVEPGESIPVYVSSEGTNGANGGPTSFGNYAVANGGLSADNLAITENVDSTNMTNNSAGYAVVWYATEDSAEEVAEQ